MRHDSFRVGGDYGTRRGQVLDFVRRQYMAAKSDNERNYLLDMLASNYDRSRDEVRTLLLETSAQVLLTKLLDTNPLEIA